MKESLDIVCIIFAGGKSSRMGKDKSLLPFAHYTTLTEYQLRRLENLFSKVYISCKESDKFNFTANFIEDFDDKLYAPTSGFLAVYKYLNVERFFVLSVDTPFVSSDDIKNLVANDKDSNDATIARTDGKIHPMCGIYHRSLEEKFQNMFKSQNHKLGFLLQRSNIKYVDLPSKNFKNLNFIDEYESAVKQINK